MNNHRLYFKKVLARILSTTRRGQMLITAIALLLLFSAIMAAPVFSSQPTDASPIVLRGTIVEPDNVIKHGYVHIEDGRIISVSDKQPEIRGAIEVNTTGIIFPGLVDVHNHITWNVFPRWDPDEFFDNKYQFRDDEFYINKVKNPHHNLIDEYFCDMNTFGEMRALVGGTTSSMTTREHDCIHGLVRNLDYDSGFYPPYYPERIVSGVDIPPASNPYYRAYFVALVKQLFSNPYIEGMFVHAAEGIDPLSYEEFTFLKNNELLNYKGAIIHGIPLLPADYEEMADTGTALVWSPRSNIELYNQTADIEAALDVGVEIALAPDWAVTGSSNMLDELRYASDWNQSHLGGRLSPQDLVDMVTNIPAHIGGIDDEVGAIQPGLRADLLVIKGDHNNPYEALITATPEDVQLVVIDGVPLYGDSKFMDSFWDWAELEIINLGGDTKVLAIPAVNFNFGDVIARLEIALAGEGASLAPLVEN